MRLAAANLAPKTIRAVFLTHLHSDHIDGLPDVSTPPGNSEEAHPLNFTAQQAHQDLVDGMMINFYAADIHIRRDLTEKLPAAGFIQISTPFRKASSIKTKTFA